MNQEKIGLFIKNIRLNNNLSQQKFADMLGVTSQAVSKWENGKNIPDISVMQDISKKFNVNIEELLNGEYNKTKENKLDKRVTIIAILIIILCLTLIVSIIIKEKKDDYKFKILLTNCQNFNITGSIAYNDVKSSIYITNVEYCGGDDKETYKQIECSLYEMNDDNTNKISTNSIGYNTTLEDFLKSVEFKVEHYSKICKHFDDNNLYLEIIATLDDNKNVNYKIPLKLTENCN